MIVIAVFKDLPLKYILKIENILIFFKFKYICYQDWLKWSVCYMSRNCCM